MGNALIAVGTRSAVFAPFEHLGLIIMDEEQEYTYKSESSPRYHARKLQNIVVHTIMLYWCWLPPPFFRELLYG